MNGAKLRRRNTAEMPEAVSSDNQQIVHDGTIHTKAAGMNRNKEYPYTQYTVTNRSLGSYCLKMNHTNAGAAKA